ncbi:MAG: amphi-Trp domain-containing protein [Desulfovibrionaceae bacterium]
MKKNEVSVKGVMNADGVSTALRDLVQSMNEGKICVEHNDAFVTLLPAEQIDFELKASAKKGKQKIEIELSWREVPPQEDVSGGLKISSTEPEITEPEDSGEEEAIPVEPPLQLEYEVKEVPKPAPAPEAGEEASPQKAKPATKKGGAKKPQGAKKATASGASG